MPRGVYVRTPETRANIAAATRAVHARPDSPFKTPEHLEKKRQASLAEGCIPPSRAGQKSSPEHVEKNRRAQLGKTVSVETRAKLSVAAAHQRRQQHKVSKLEYEVAPELVCQGFTHNTDRAVRIIGSDGFCKIPDFVDVEGRRLVEVWGDYWHRGEDPEVLIEWYRQVGWDCKVIWEREIKEARS